MTISLYYVKMFRTELMCSAVHCISRCTKGIIASTDSVNALRFICDIYAAFWASVRELLMLSRLALMLEESKCDSD